MRGIIPDIQQQIRAPPRMLSLFFIFIYWLNVFLPFASKASQLSMVAIDYSMIDTVDWR